MHELAAVQGIIKVCTDELKKCNAARVKEITIVVGKLTGLVPSYVQHCFDAASQGTAVEGAKLKVMSKPVVIRCIQCSNQSEITDMNFACPVCGGERITIVSGREFYVESMEVDDFEDKGCKADT